MSLVSDILDDALMYIGAYGPGETVSSDDQTFALRICNRALDGWSARKLSPIGVKHANYTLSGAASYTYGPAMTWNATTRPIKVKAASTIAADGVETPAVIVTAEEWVQIRDKTRTGLFVRELLYDGGYPTGNIYVTPMPAAGSCSLWTYEAITDFVNLTDTVSLPPGFERALVIALGLELCIPFQRPIPDGLPQLAVQAMEDIATLTAEILGTPAPQPAQPTQQGPKQ
jgi:hypothetical protein